MLKTVDFSLNYQIESKRVSRDVRSFLYAHTDAAVAALIEPKSRGKKHKRDGICYCSEATNHKAGLFD